MTGPARELTEAQKEAIAFLKRPKPNFYNWLAKERAAEELAEKEAAAMKEAEAAAFRNPQLGQLMPDGTLFAGMAPDGKQVFALSTDLSVIMTFNEAAKCVTELNAQNSCGHNDWIIPKKDILRVLHQNKDKGALANTFKISADGSNHPGWYWSSTVPQEYPPGIWAVYFPSGSEQWIGKDTIRMNCRPVRLVPVP